MIYFVKNLVVCEFQQKLEDDYLSVSLKSYQSIDGTFTEGSPSQKAIFKSKKSSCEK